MWLLVLSSGCTAVIIIAIAIDIKIVGVDIEGAIMAVNVACHSGSCSCRARYRIMALGHGIRSSCTYKFLLHTHA